MKEYSQVLKSNKYVRGRDLCGYQEVYVLKDVVVIHAAPWARSSLVLDPKGYFLIRLHEGNIEIGLVNWQHEMVKIVKGNNIIDLMHEMIKQEMVSRLDHAAYLGIQLERAAHCLRNNLEFVQ